MPLLSHDIFNESSATNFLDFAERHGFALLEVHAGQKRPVGDDWQNRASKDRVKWDGWLSSGSNLGILAGASDIATVDIEAGRWELAAEWFRSELGIEIPEPHVSSARGGWHIFFRLPDSFKRSKLKFAWGDLIVGNSQTVAPPSCFDGKHYRFFPKTTEIYDGAVLLKLWPERKERVAAAAPALDGYRIEEVSWWIDRKLAGEWALSQLDWVLLGKALKLHFPNEDGLDLFLRMSEDTDTAAARWNKDHDFRTEWREGDRTLHYYLDRDVTWMFRGLQGCPVAPKPPSERVEIPAAILEHYKRQREQYAASLLGPLPELLADAPSIAPDLPSGAVSLIGGGDSSPADSEDALALSFADLHADDLRYCEEWGRWLHWTGQAWTPDKRRAPTTWFASISAHLPPAVFGKSSAKSPMPRRSPRLSVWPEQIGAS
jgi:hypothetical protein